MRTIPRNHTIVLAGLRPQLPHVTRHRGPRDPNGTPVPAAEAWEHFDQGPTRGYWPRLRELDHRAGTYELRIDHSLRYELRRAAPAAGHRIDVVIDRDPDDDTGVTVYVNGAKSTGPDVHVHVLDPGAGGADHEWLTGHLEHSTAAPLAVRSKITTLAEHYHSSRHCDHADCDA